MIKVFSAVSLNWKIGNNLKGSSVFNKYTSNKLIEFRKKVRNNTKAILVGANTINIDNPRLLNDKENNIRIIIDNKGNLPLESKIFTIKPNQTYVLLNCSNFSYAKTLKKKGVNVIEIINYSTEQLKTLINHLSNNNLLIEGGYKTIKYFIDNNFIDELTFIQFPIILSEDFISLNIEFLSKYNIKISSFDKQYILIKATK